MKARELQPQHTGFAHTIPMFLMSTMHYVNEEKSYGGQTLNVGTNVLFTDLNMSVLI